MSSSSGAVPHGRHIPHLHALGAEPVFIESGRALVRVPYADHLVGDPTSGVVHGGVITAILDNASGMAVFSGLERITSIATLDLRIDYMRPATPERELLARAECYRVTGNIAFVRGAAFHLEPGADPGPYDRETRHRLKALALGDIPEKLLVATSTAAFILSSNATRKLHAENAEDD